MARFTSLLAASTLYFATLGHGWDQSLYNTSPPEYPTPKTHGTGWEAALAQAKDFVKQLTLEEKAYMVTGTTGPCAGNIAPISRLGFEGLCLQDGPLAIRQAIYADVFPAGLTAAASFDRDLMYKRGVYMGSEFKTKGAHIALGPVAGPLGRSPFGGRNWEGFSPDPYLTGVGMEETITGMQSSGCQTTAKHYIGNEQETQRNPSTLDDGTTIEAISSNIDDRTMHELYLWPFANAVKAGTAAVMCSYNRLNESYGCQNSKTLNGLLKTELGFQGYVMSDWTAVHTGIASMKAGLDMNMPGGISFSDPEPSYWGSNLTKAVTNGTLSLSRLDDSIIRIMTPYYHLQQQSYPYPDESSASLNFWPISSWVKNFTTGPVTDARTAAAKELVHDMAVAGTVLLKNVGGVLPLKQPKDIGVFGNDAADFTAGQYSLSLSAGISAGDYDIGVLGVGGGSGTGRFSYISVPLEEIKSKTKEWNGLVQYITDNSDVIESDLSSLAPTPPEVCIVFLKAWASEGSDRATLLPDWNGTAVVNTVTSVCNNTVVVLHGPGPIVMPFADNDNITAIVAAHMPGQEAGSAIVDVLFGAVNPSGHLPYTIAHKQSDYEKLLINSTALVTTTDPNAWQANYKEGLMIDYREFDYYNKKPLYPFGHGLSYTTFALSGLETSKTYSGTLKSTPSGKIVPGGHEDLWDTVFKVTATVQNTGSIAGAAVPQLYLGFGSPSAGTPKRVLRGFEKVQLAPGASSTVEFEIMRRDISYWNVNTQKWTLYSGITAEVGFSERNIKLSGSLGI